MIKRKVRPAEEETGGVLLPVLFSIGWYSAIGVSVAGGGFHPWMILFMIFGLLPLYQMLTGIRHAMFYRRQRAEAIASGKAFLSA
ncbi:MAG TPA: hypothetical protein H9695_10015 [Candidatus Mediterraneibacter excrementigallinarum]|nr:hypothetical protein [Candidatus Mediterraneibacter excrementigallinarum]